MSLLESPRLYDFVQALSGRRIAHRRIGRAIEAGAGEAVLDVGAGTGSLARVLPSGALYWALDNDPAKLRRLVVKVPSARVLQRSALSTQLPDKAVDWTVCVALAHHLDDEQLPLMVDEMARITKRRLVFLDPLRASGPGVAALLWRCDRGSHPRSAETLLAALRARFEIDRVERFRIFHRYLLCSGRPLTHT